MKRLEELENLIKTYGGIVVVKIIQKKGVPNYETYIGKGKLNKIMEIAEEKGAELLILNNILKPRQIFNLNEKFREKKVEVKTWDRVDLILKIFDKHAQSAEAKLQIELASIRHMGPRIFGMGMELSRQAGAVGLRAGQGESNTELMKRHLQKQELKIKEKLEHHEKINAGHRKRRRRNNFKTVALVGYTNAGKSSLLNAVTKKKAYVANELFATLDTRIGELYIPDCYQKILMSDTIGFIQDLPPNLIQAFKSTLAETIEADLLLHVIDINDTQITQKIKVVEEILDKLDLSHKPKIYVFNKIDLINTEKEQEEPDYIKERPPGVLEAGKETAKILGWHYPKPDAPESLDVLKRKYKKYSPVFISANEKMNLDELKEVIKKEFEE